MNKQISILLSVIVPCFNEQAVIRATHQRFVEALGDHQEFALEIIYVNDGSCDQTEEILFHLAAGDKRIKVISLSRNFGHQPAVSAGLEYAKGDIVVIADADLQDPPEVIPKMIAKWREGFDVVYGVRTKRKEGILKRFSYAGFYRLYRSLASVDVQLDSGDFALLDRRVVDVLNSLPEKNRFMRGLRAWTGFRQTGLVYERAARAGGETKYPFNKCVRLALDGIFNFSTTPLSIIFIAGIVISITAILAALTYMAARLGDFTIFGHNPGDAPGFTTIIIAILFFSGVQLLSVGILGEYLGRLYQEAKMRPSFIVKEVKGLNVTASALDDLRSYRSSRLPPSDVAIQMIKPRATKKGIGKDEVKIAL
jgi:polyisoprenyl-phosphate glycosyltransferase